MTSKNQQVPTPVSSCRYKDLLTSLITHALRSCRSNPFPMGASDPLPAGYEIRFESLEFRATGNSYLMELLSPRRNPDTPTSPARRNRRSGQHSRQARMERRRAARLSSPTWVEVAMSQLSVAADGATASSSRASASSTLAPSSTAALVPP